MRSAANIVLIGPMGAGKSSIGKQLAHQLDLTFIDLDREIEKRTGATVSTIFNIEGEAGFRAREHAALIERLEQRNQMIATGGGAVLNAESRRIMMQKAFVIHLDLSVEEQMQRLRHDRARPLLQSADREQILQRLRSERHPLYQAACDLYFDTGSHTIQSALHVLLPLISAQYTPNNTSSFN